MVDVLAYLLAFSLALKDKPRESLRWNLGRKVLTCCSENHGLCRALSYIIQTLSAERSFGDKLSQPVRIQVPAKWQTVGTTADFMITVGQLLIASCSVLNVF